MGWRLDQLFNGENLRLKHLAAKVRIGDPDEAVSMLDSVYRIFLARYPGMTVGEIGDMRIDDVSARFRAISRGADDELEKFMAMTKLAKTQAILNEPGWDGAAVNSEGKWNNWGDPE